MCKIKSEEWETSKDQIRARVRNPTHICTKCFRVSTDKSLLCKPKKIK